MKLGILISGRGSNLQAIIDAIASGELVASIAIVISNRADAGGLARAELADIPTLVMPHKAYPTAPLTIVRWPPRSRRAAWNWSAWPASCGCWAPPSSTSSPMRY